MKQVGCGGRLAGAVLMSFMAAAHAASPTAPEGACPQDEKGVAGIEEVFTCGAVSGSFRLHYHTTHNAFFVEDFDQDTVSYGGFLKFETAPVADFQAAVSGILLRGIDHPARNNVISYMGDDQTNIGEAWLSWRRGQFQIKAGNQRLSIPFMGDYDWRITPILYRGVDARYGDNANFLHATKIWRYKPWGDDQFLSTTAYTEIEESTNGMWAVGGGRTALINDKKLTGQLWYQEYDDYSKVIYAESHLSWPTLSLKPDLGVQVLRGNSDGKALVGVAKSTSVGTQLGLALTPSLSLTLNYNYIKPDSRSWNNGALVVPYAHFTAAGPYFAQPIFTSTQDLGAGNAWSTHLYFVASDRLSMGAHYSFMDLKPAAATPSINQSEYLLHFTWSFKGALKGLSVTDFAGVQTSPSFDADFWQNRLNLKYDF